jgi:hypothetical protein
MKIIRMKRISGRERRREERKSEPKSGHPADMRYPYIINQRRFAG